MNIVLFAAYPGIMLCLGIVGSGACLVSKDANLKYKVIGRISP